MFVTLLILIFYQVMILLQKTNNDWWSVRQSSGKEGYVPANYVKEIDPKVVKKMVRRPVKVKEKVMVKKPAVKKEVVKKKKRPGSLRRSPSGRDRKKERGRLRERESKLTTSFDQVLFSSIWHYIEMIYPLFD